jgi:heme exporter protein C
MGLLYRTAVFIIITGVLIAGFIIPVPDIPGLGEKARNLYFHVPMSWTAVIAFLVSMIYSLKYLKTKDHLNDIKANSAASLGFMFCTLAFVTGAVWSRFNWGTFIKFNDPRIISILVLLLIYGAYFTLRSSVNDAEQKAKLSAVYLTIAFVTVPFFIFIMPRIFPGLHPGSADSPNSGPVMSSSDLNPTMRIIFYTSCAGFIMLFFWIYNLKVKIESHSLSISHQNFNEKSYV